MVNWGVISKYLGFDIIGGFGVDIFFVISGFIMAYTISDYSKPERFGIGWSFIKKKDTPDISPSCFSARPNDSRIYFGVYP